MPNFKDANGAEWALQLDAPTILAVREEGDPDFLKGDPAATITRMDADPVLLCGVIWVMCKKQAESRGVKQEQFYGNLVGDAIDRAADGFLDSLLFFTRSRDRDLLKARAETNRRIVELATATALEKINDPALTQQAVDKINESIDAALGTLSSRSPSATSLPESSASTPSD